MKDTNRTYPVDMSIKPEVTGFFDEDTNTISYVVKDPGSNACAVVDSVLDLDYAAGRTAYEHADRIIDFIRENDLDLVLQIETHVAMHTPGHTPACMTHVIGDAAFVGDTLFMPDMGSARADFPGGDAGQLYDSVQKILALPDEMRLFMCHDYAPGGREIMWETTVKEEKENNIHFGNGTTREEFIRMRQERDAQLDMPRLIIPSLQVNMRAGAFPPPDEEGDVFLKVPVNKL